MRAKKKIRTAKQYVHSYYSDIRRYTRWAGGSNDSSVSVLEAKILKEFHRIEKGISLPSPREWFGRDTIERLLVLCISYLDLDPVDKTVVGDAIQALNSYSTSFETAPPEWWKIVQEEIRQLSSRLDEDGLGRGGRTRVGVPDRNSSEEISKFIRSRRSIRNFTANSVPSETLEMSVLDARFSPSVCNRQAIRVRFYDRGENADRLLSVQNGNRGFGHTASHIALVTGDLSAFLTPGERNQVYIDGGLFSMTLINSLWSRGVGTCCLNWSATAKQDNQLRRAIGIPSNEVVIMMIALGYPTADSYAANSPRLDLGRILIPGAKYA